MESALTRAGWRDESPGESELLRSGDAAAFERIVRENRRAVYLMARRVLGDHDSADEAAQVAFVRAWQGRRKFRGASSVRTWLIRIALNVARSMRGSRRGGETPHGFEAIPDRSPGSEERVRRRQLRERVRRAVAALPDRQREAVLLKVFSDLTCKETAEIMGLSEGAVKAHLHQAVGNLRRIMRAAAGEEAMR
jgi:RNA polymerase sigma-70 factor (ECF subfamily)